MRRPPEDRRTGAGGWGRRTGSQEDERTGGQEDRARGQEDRMTGGQEDRRTRGRMTGEEDRARGQEGQRTGQVHRRTGQEDKTQDQEDRGTGGQKDGRGGFASWGHVGQEDKRRPKSALLKCDFCLPSIIARTYTALHYTTLHTAHCTTLHTHLDIWTPDRLVYCIALHYIVLLVAHMDL